ncbi:MAG TPA: hypothetical protein VIK33_14375 [Anaerolineae bacterium]
MKRTYVLLGLIVLLVIVLALSSTAPPRAVVETASPYSSPRPTFAFPTGTPVPVTSDENTLIEYEPGPLYVILSTLDEHGLPGDPAIDLKRQPDPNAATSVGRVPTGSFAQVVEIRRLPPDYLRSFYRIVVRAGASNTLEGWVGDWYVRRTAFVVAFDEQGCACPFRVPLWADAQIAQSVGQIANRSPLRLLALADQAVQVQVLSDGTIGWLSRDIVHESQDKEFLRRLAP